MYSKLYIFCLCLITNTLVVGQYSSNSKKVQWAAQVVDYSSEFDYKAVPAAFNAQQVLGPASVHPSYGESFCAWVPKKANTTEIEFIQVSFEEAMAVRQIFINENYNPGAIYRIILIDEKGQQQQIIKRRPQPVFKENAREGRLFCHKMSKITDYKVKEIRLELSTVAVPGYNSIDAIGISANDEVYEIPINTVEGAESVADPELLGIQINSDGEELAPIISPDDQTLYFTRQKHPENTNPDKQDIWYASKDENGVFQTAQNIGAPLNTKSNNALCAVSPDGQSVLLTNKYLSDGTSLKGVSVSQRTASGWSFPEEVIIEDFYNDNKFCEFFLASDAKTLLLAIQRKDAVGSKDIYVSFKKENGEFSVPKNLGPVINTTDSEISPFLATDGKTLYFSSGGFPGYGDKDVFVSRRLDDSWTNWSVPQNLGPRINSTSFDAYYSISAKGDYAYFSSVNIDDDNNDIYRVKLPEAARPKPVVLIYGNVVDAKTKAPLGATDIYYESLNKNQEIGQAKSSHESGAYNMILSAGHIYGFRAHKDGYIAINQHIDLIKEIDEYKEIKINLELTPIKKDAVIRLNNIFFDPNKYSLKAKDELELERIVEMMKVYPKMRIQISGHTDNVGTEQDNMILSENRAKSIHNFLESKGIAANRLTFKGYGEKYPQVDNGTAAGRTQNRRIELKILAVD